MAVSALHPDLQATFRIVADTLADAADPWWIITSAAAALHGVRPIVVRDVDVLISVRDAVRLRDRGDITTSETPPHPLFRSSVFLIGPPSPLAIELMAGFRVARGYSWDLIEFAARDHRPVGDCTMFVPSRGELARLFRQMGRPKDIERAHQLEAPGRDR